MSAGGPDLHAFAVSLSSLLERGKGARVGETAVVSRRVHVIEVSHPNDVQIRSDADAGGAFYGRRTRDQVVHIDVFHSLGDVSQVAVAAVLRRAVDEWALECRATGAEPVLADAVDVQTAMGGGRITGSLGFGGKQSLRAAHRGHVHVAALLPTGAEGFVYLAVRGVEQAVMAARCELRKVERVLNVASESGSPLDLDPYTAATDSIMREDGDCTQQRAENMTQQALDAAADFGSVDALCGFLEQLAAKGHRESPYSFLDREYGEGEAIVSRLRAMGLVRGDGSSLTTTEKGDALTRFMRKAARELEVKMRRIIRRANSPSRLPLDRCDYSGGRHTSAHGKPLSRREVPRREAATEAISVPATIIRWSGRCAAAGLRVLPAPDDLMVSPAKRRQPMNICLLIDASASMAGSRIQAARHLARHVFYSCRDRVSLLTFQDRDVTAHVVGARSARALEVGLSTVRPRGLTPMAAGIEQAVKLLVAKGTLRTMLVLLTDGIPTMNYYTSDPARDALTAAERISDAGIPFTCIGLSPNKSFLKRLSEVARGTLYIVEEFDRDLLAKLVVDERGKLGS